MNEIISFPTNFIVLSDYEIKNDVVLPTKKALTDYKEGTYRTFNPISDEQVIYAEIAKIDVDDKKSILKFVNEFGIPTTSNGSHLITDKNHILNLALNFTELYLGINLIQSRTKTWGFLKQENGFFEAIYEQDWYHQKVLESANIEKNNYTINKLIELLLSEDLYDIEDKIESITNTDTYKFRNSNNTFSNISTEEKVKEVYVNKINRWSKGYDNFSIVNGQIKKELLFNDLFDVANYQLSEAILQNKELKHCENCGHLFEPAHGSQKFCSPLPGRKRSTCENTYNQRLKRQRKKEQEQAKK
ncbi:hypothetical protein DN407_29585 (plasmid) [Bacillus sp. JAS24-2]|uniref:DUF6076 domain-containing protein n=1 Tax=Bacillus sp. JAS24-2 TaxID=2217832 RepID=UPI0011EC7F6E|nr:DUF6076 domain-containing protein [Bacillus sp. JAS24-2]QEL82649.1 hypothetical protein DN407_29585 [Bacillus sp. JAS24-2]